MSDFWRRAWQKVETPLDMNEPLLPCSSIQVGDTFLVNGVVLEVVDEHDGLYHLNNAGVDVYMTAEQVLACERAGAL